MAYRSAGEIHTLTKSARRLDERLTTVSSAIDRFVQEKLIGLSTQSKEASRANAVRRSPLGDLPLPSITNQAIRDYCKDRLEHVAASTVHNEARLIRLSVETARREWGLKLPFNPAIDLELPPCAPRRRVIVEGELEAIYAALEQRPLMRAFVELTVETGISRGELLKLQWEDVDLDGSIITIRTAGSDEKRTVPLSVTARSVLQGLQDGSYRVFHLSVARVRWGWEAACRRAKVEDLRLNDLRRMGGPGSS